jgi:hypothetical protein
MIHRIIRQAGVVVLLLLSARIGSSQAFVDLNFESARITNGTPLDSFVTFSNAFPGWSGYYTQTGALSSNQTASAWYDAISLGGYLISIVDTNLTPSGFGPLNGKYSAALFGGFDPGSGYWASTISQTGLVPAGTETLTIDAEPVFPRAPGSSFTVSLNGQAINLYPARTFSNYTVFSGNISAFAGHVATLAITVPPPAPGITPPSGYSFDNIVFSPIPEPGVLGLLCLGGLFCGLALRRGFPAQRR